MGQCKICGAEVEEGKDICASCQQDLERIDIDIGDMDINLEDFELPELSGELMESDLEFELDDPNNNLENPDIFVHDMVAENPLLEEVLPETVLAEEKVDMPEKTDVDKEAIADIPDLTGDLGELLSTTGDNSSEEVMDLSGLLPESDILDIGLDLNDGAASVSNEDKSLMDDVLGAMDSGGVTETMDAMANVDDILGGIDVGDTTNTTTNAVDDLLGGMSDDILNLFPDNGETENVAMEAEMPDLSLEDNLDILGAVPDAEEIAELAKPKEKISIWKHLFGNIKDEKWEKQKEREANEEAAKLAKIEEQKAKEAEVAKEEEGSEDEPKIDPKEAKKAEKLAKKEEKARRKEEKKAEKQRLKELAELEDADEGRINRLGAAIVFVFLGVVAVFVIIGTSVFNYNGSINRASVYFKEDQYSAAYDEISGLDVKPKDQELYEQIRTVMFVNKELNSYQNYTGIRMYPEALDSLIKGLEKYDKHIDDAKDMDVSEDLDKVRGRIISELKNEYGLSEKEAYKLLNTSNREAYSKKVIEIANQ